VIRAARSLHPSVSSSDDDLAEFLSRRFECDDLDDSAALRNAGDLLIACGVLAGDPPAIDVLERAAIAPLRAKLARMVGEGAVDEVMQQLRETLLMAAPPRTAGITGYAGRGPLRAWVRAVAVRIALRIKAQNAGTDQPEPVLEAPVDAPELHALRAHYAGDFRHAFESALRALRPRERMLLRQQFVDGLGTEALAALHRVHRVTMYRQMLKIRRKVLSKIRGQLASRIVNKHSELESIMRALKGTIELTLERVLASQSAA
jgi:RNA polymerase sigma-70 factor (ECF subfamily)